MIENVELVLRAACAGICTLMIAHLVSIRPISRKTLSAISLVVAAAGMVIVSSKMSVIAAMDSENWAAIIRIVIAFNAPMVAWGLLELFDDDFRIKRWQIAFVSLSVPSHLLTHLHPALDTLCHLSSIFIYSYVFYVAVMTRAHDLVQARCLFRLWFMSAAAIAGIIFTGLHAYYGNFGLPAGYYIFKAFVMFVLAIIFAYWALKVREHVWAMPHHVRNTIPENLSPAETGLLQKLQTSMKDSIWKQEGLTIRKLAEELDAPEHRLRKVINQGLGYRNFAHFVNEHRIEAACEVLSDPVRADVPIISVAYEVGYASLGPFNRAFREIVGESPTEYRKRSVVHA